MDKILRGLKRWLHVYTHAFVLILVIMEAPGSSFASPHLALPRHSCPLSTFIRLRLPPPPLPCTNYAMLTVLPDSTRPNRRRTYLISRVTVTPATARRTIPDRIARYLPPSLGALPGKPQGARAAGGGGKGWRG